MRVSNITSDAVIDELRKVKGPDFESDIVSLGLVSEIFISDGKVFFSITVPDERAQELEPLRQAAQKVVEAMDGVKAAIVTLTAEKKGSANAVKQQIAMSPIKHRQKELLSNRGTRARRLRVRATALVKKSRSKGSNILLLLHPEKVALANRQQQSIWHWHLPTGALKQGFLMPIFTGRHCRD